MSASSVKLEFIAAFDLPAYGIHFKVIINRLGEKIAASEKFLFIIVHAMPPSLSVLTNFGNSARVPSLRSVFEVLF